MTSAERGTAGTFAAGDVAVVLDPDPFFLGFQTFLLGGNGYTVRSPATPEEFTAKWVLAQRPDLIVTEVLLPGRSGLDLVRELRASAELQATIIVYSVLRVNDRALSAGADRFLLKPLMRESYLTALNDAAKRRP